MIAKKIPSMLLVLFGGVLATAAAAATFPDVPAGHLFREPIEALVNASIINGNPDGNFYPDRKVNRAEMLKMLYKASGKVPDVASSGCFTDVEKGSWYESFVCDAAAHHYVEGYSSDGTFRPANPVNRVESLKMITQVLAIEIPEMAGDAREIVKFVDVSTSAWYTKYLYAAYVKGILPIAGQETGRFYPDWPLLRGEAAAMIYNALNVALKQDRQESSSSSSSAQSVASEGTSSASSQSTSSGVSSQASAAASDTTFPIESSGKFNAKKSFSYTFTLDRNLVASTEVKLQSGQPGAVSCRLYLLEEQGFSFEYYLGFQENGGCFMKTALRPGKYQLQLQPTSPDTTFSVSVKETTGDGNDGFREAQALLSTVARTGTLMPEDYQDWFTFTAAKEKEMQITVSDSTQITCSIYPMGDVTLSDFAGPKCNQHYLFPSGTYYVGIGRTFPGDAKQTYTVLMQ
ncbi:MAG: S-layer homology domain-containing protein [Candidatus Peribacteraceae bacterium]|nr:S-layer homology domain-containing protein [Candidatus Peribacteraceae bacterium]MDD5075155.1 S-layer homology domain-containing protein [Candidatus Peribacteraceae bacterium]